jgi:hypothetical protein
MDIEIIIGGVFAALVFAVAAEALSKAKAKSAIAFEKKHLEASAEKARHLNLFFQICGTSNYFEGVLNFRNYGFDAKPGLLHGLTSKHSNLPPFLERIKGKQLEECMALEISKDEMDLIEAIVLQTIKAACLGIISKSNRSLKVDDALTQIKGEIEVGYYWAIVAHSMAEVKIMCDDKTVYRTFFELEMMK